MSWGLGSLGLRIIAIRIPPPARAGPCTLVVALTRRDVCRGKPGEAGGMAGGGRNQFRARRARGVMCRSVHTRCGLRNARTAVASAGAARVGPPCTDTGRTPIGAAGTASVGGVREPQPHFQFSLRFRDVTRGAADVCTLTDVQFLTLASPGNPLRHVGVQN